MTDRMPKAIEQLQIDHRNMTRLLDLLRRELDRLSQRPAAGLRPAEQHHGLHAQLSGSLPSSDGEFDL